MQQLDPEHKDPEDRREVTVDSSRDGHVVESWPARLVGERTAGGNGGVGYAAPTAVNSRSELLIFVRPGDVIDDEAVTPTPADLLIAPC
jgi:hypothetical protein